MSASLVPAPIRHATAPRPGLRPPDVLSLALTAVMTAASLSGLLIHDLYRDNAWSRAAFRGTDAATLVLAVPTLIVALLLARRGSLRARLVWLGVLAYNVYNYAFYLFGSAFNDFFLLYAAALGLSVVLLVFATPQVLPEVGAGFPAGGRAIGGLLILVGAGFGALWTLQSLRYAFTGRLPQVISDSGIHTSIVFALDLTLVVPWLVLAGVLLWRRRAGGVLLGVVMNVVAVLYMAALAVSGAFQQDAGLPGATWSTPPYLEVGILSLAVLVVLLRAAVTATSQTAAPAIPRDAGLAFGERGPVRGVAFTSARSANAGRRG